MIRALWNAAAGMQAQQLNVDTIANNLANVNTTGYRKVRAEFQDLIYVNSNIAGTPASRETVRPLDISVGHGSKVAASHRLFNQGILRASENFSDLAIRGAGFFRLVLPDGSFGYTRDGSFKVDARGQLVTSQGYQLDPPIFLPENFIPDDVSVDASGAVRLTLGQQLLDVGQLQLVRFVNPAGLTAIGDNVFIGSEASGKAISGNPGTDGMGTVLHKFLEYSNVNMADEMVNMIVAQRAYDFNSKAIQTSDNLLQTAVNLKR